MKLDKNGRCCCRKSIGYKGGSPGVPFHFSDTVFHFCTFCKREYDMNGMQRENSTWKKNAVGRYCRRNSEDRRGYIIMRGYEDRRRMLLKKGSIHTFPNHPTKEA